MNPALIIIIVLAAIIAWFLLARFYKPVGTTVVDMGEYAINEMKEEDDEETSIAYVVNMDESEEDF